MSCTRRSLGAARKKGSSMPCRAKPIQYSASASRVLYSGAAPSTGCSSYPSGSIARATSMMGLGSGGENRMLVATVSPLMGRMVPSFIVDTSGGDKRGGPTKIAAGRKWPARREGELVGDFDTGHDVAAVPLFIGRLDLRALLEVVHRQPLGHREPGPVVEHDLPTTRVHALDLAFDVGRPDAG